MRISAIDLQTFVQCLAHHLHHRPSLRDTLPARLHYRLEETEMSLFSLDLRNAPGFAEKDRNIHLH